MRDTPDVFGIRVHSGIVPRFDTISTSSIDLFAVFETICPSIAMAVPSAASYRAYPGLHRAIGGSGVQNIPNHGESEDYQHPMNIEEVNSLNIACGATICAELCVRNGLVRSFTFEQEITW